MIVLTTTNRDQWCQCQLLAKTIGRGWHSSVTSGCHPGISQSQRTFECLRALSVALQALIFSTSNVLLCICGWTIFRVSIELGASNTVHSALWSSILQTKYVFLCVLFRRGLGIDSYGRGANALLMSLVLKIKVFAPIPRGRGSTA